MPRGMVLTDPRPRLADDMARSARRRTRQRPGTVGRQRRARSHPRRHDQFGAVSSTDSARHPRIPSPISRCRLRAGGAPHPRVGCRTQRRCRCLPSCGRSTVATKIWKWKPCWTRIWWSRCQPAMPRRAAAGWRCCRCRLSRSCGSRARSVPMQNMHPDGLTFQPIASRVLKARLNLLWRQADRGAPQLVRLRELIRELPPPPPRRRA